MKYSYFRGKNQPPYSELTDTEVVDLIQHNEDLRNSIAEIRRYIDEKNPQAADHKKGELPALTFSARFTGGRRYDKLEEYNGEIVLDFDKKSPEELAFIRQIAASCPHTHLGFLSPRGNGYKLTVRTSLPDGTLPQSPEEVRNYHAHAYDQASLLYEELCRTDIDGSGKDMVLLCYLSHDEDVYFNPRAETLVVDPTRPLREKEKKSPGRKKPSEHICYTPGENRALLATLLFYHDHKENYKEGNRNNYLYKLACTYNCYGIPKEDVHDFLHLNFPDLPPDETGTLINNAYQHTDEYNTRKLNTTQWNFLHIEQYISNHYDTRYNLVKHRMECRKKGESNFCELDELMENSIWMELNEAGYACSVKNMGNLIYSDFSQSFHPICQFMQQLPTWDGIDHIGRLAASVHTANPAFWLKGLTNFLVGMIAAATRENVVNHLCLLLCSKPNLGKTTFINQLLPPELRADYLSTGNRRFLCFEVDWIDHIEIDYPQLYAQIKYLLDSGYRYWFEADENDEIERNNEPFLFQSPEEEMLLTHFRKPERFETVRHMTVSEIAETIRLRTGYQYTHASKIMIGKILSKYNFQYTTSKNVKCYEVFLIDAETVKGNQIYQ